MTAVAPRAQLAAGPLPTSAGPAWFPLAIYRGDTYRWTFVLWSDPDKTEPVDLTDVAVKAEIRDRSAGTQIIELACTVTLPNTIDVALEAADSSSCPTGGWDLQLTYTDTTVVTVLAGQVRVTGDITDSTP